MTPMPPMPPYGPYGLSPSPNDEIVVPGTRLMSCLVRADRVRPLPDRNRIVRAARVCRTPCAPYGPYAVPSARRRRKSGPGATPVLQLAGTRAEGFVLTREKAAGKWRATTYAVIM